LDFVSTQSPAAGDRIELLLAARLRELRVRHDLTLDELAARSGVSRSMISLIERAQSSPTAHILDRLAAALGVTLASLFTDAGQPGASPVARRGDQLSWRDPETGYVRRNLSPPGVASPLELVEVVLPSGARVTYDGVARSAPVDQQILLLAGTLEVSVGAQAHRLDPGDCLAMRVDGPTAFCNPGPGEARYLLALIIGAVPPARIGTARRSQS